LLSARNPEQIGAALHAWLACRPWAAAVRFTWVAFDTFGWRRWCACSSCGWACATRASAGTAVLRNYPVIGHLRFLLEFIRPEIRQYFIESDNEAVPFSRQQRSLVYQRAKGEPDKRPFGTQLDVQRPGLRVDQPLDGAHHGWPATTSASRSAHGGSSAPSPMTPASSTSRR
jgi:hypothetical protein